MKIALCGFMGSGKSTLIGQLERDIVVADLDELIVDAIQKLSFKDIPSFVESEGWEKFRDIESEQLSKYIKLHDSFVLALGGGAVTIENTAIMKAEGVTLLWLDVPFDECWSRIKDDANRPLVLKGRVENEKLYNERKKIYSSAGKKISPDAVKNLQDIEALLNT